jgi:hypothetical protein
MDTNARACTSTERVECESCSRRLCLSECLIGADPAMWVETVHDQYILINLKICDLHERVTPDVGVTMEGVGLGVDRHPLWDVLAAKRRTTLRYDTR